MSNQAVELVIIGSGPAGYTAAVYAARAGLAPAVLAGSVTAGGALMTTTEVENFPGFIEGVQGPELMESMRQQAERFGARIVLDDAIRVDLDGPVKTIETGAGEAFRAPAVILAMGSAYRKLGLPNEERLTGRGVSWCAMCDGIFFVDRPSTRTNLAGVYAAGDLVDHTYRQAITAAGTGCAAAQDAQHFLASLENETAPLFETEEVLA